MDLRRITVVTVQGRFDLSIPASVPLAYLIPTVLRQAGPALAELGAAQGGWVLQRLGSSPFDTAAAPAALGIADGELLYLQPRRGALPTPVFDDAAEAIGTTLAERSRPWDEAAGRAVGLATGAGALLAAGIAALLAGPPWTGPAAALGVSTLVLLFCGALMSRAAGDGAVAALLGCAAVLDAALAVCLGTLALHGGRSSGGGQPGPALLAGAAAGLLVCALAALASGAGGPELTGAALVCGCGLVAGAVITLKGAAAEGSQASITAGAAGALVAAYLWVPFIPTFAYRAARLPKPFLPSTAEQLRAAEGVTPGARLADRAVRADRYVTALVGACVTVTAAAGWFLGPAPGWACPTLVALACALAGLRMRTLRGRAQRLALSACAVVLGVEEVAGVARLHSGVIGAAVVAAATLAAVPLAVLAGRETRTLTPPTARALDIAEGLCALAVLPVALQVLGVYAALRGLGR
jgi:type VII secretion integral membrane protein EccD